MEQHHVIKHRATTGITPIDTLKFMLRDSANFLEGLWLDGINVSETVIPMWTIRQ